MPLLGRGNSAAGPGGRPSSFPRKKWAELKARTNGRYGKIELRSNHIKSNYFIVRLKVDQRAGQLSLPHLGITKTEKIELKHKTDE